MFQLTEPEELGKHSQPCAPARTRMLKKALFSRVRRVHTTNVGATVFVVIVATKRGFSVSNKLIRAATGITVILFARIYD